MVGSHTDRHAGADAAPFGLDALLPCPAPRLTWTCAAPVFEYAIRSALCGGLEVTAWPQMGTEWAFLVAPPDGAGRGSFHAGRLASAAAGADRWIVRRRARRILGTVSEWSAGDHDVLEALRRGRVRTDLAARLTDDLLLTSARLRDVAFRVWSHHAHVAAAEWAMHDPVSPEALAVRLTACGPLPLWGGEGGEAESARSAGRAVVFGDMLRTAFAEIRILLDEIGRRGTAGGVLDAAPAIADHDWNAIPALVSGLADRPM